MTDNVRRCGICKTDQNLNLFQKKKNKILKVCSACYEKHCAPLCRTARRRNPSLKIIARQQRQKLVFDYLQNNPCVDCGEENILVLEFDHREPKDKKYYVSDLIQRGSISSLNTEIVKCDVVCSNCHSIRTAKMFGSWKLTFLENFPGKNF